MFVTQLNCSRKLQYVHILSIGYSPVFSEQILLYRVTQTSSQQQQKKKETVISEAVKSGYKDVTVRSLGRFLGFSCATYKTVMQ
jgi:hypothetical protein